MGKAEQRELTNRLVVLLAHLLKWRSQPSHRGRSWEPTIAEQRAQIEDVLEDSPGLRKRLGDEAWIGRAWKRAVLTASRETGLDDFPESCPWFLEEVVRDGWVPD